MLYDVKTLLDNTNGKIPENNIGKSYKGKFRYEYSSQTFKVTSQTYETN